MPRMIMKNQQQQLLVLILRLLLRNGHPMDMTVLWNYLNENFLTIVIFFVSFQTFWYSSVFPILMTSHYKNLRKVPSPMIHRSTSHSIRERFHMPVCTCRRCHVLYNNWGGGKLSIVLSTTKKKENTMHVFFVHDFLTQSHSKIMFQNIILFAIFCFGIIIVLFLFHFS